MGRGLTMRRCMTRNWDFRCMEGVRAYLSINRVENVLFSNQMSGNTLSVSIVAVGE